jgi:hypothetical protein
VRETLNHFSNMSKMPETAFAVISRDLRASNSSIGSSETSIWGGTGGTALSCPGRLVT